MSAETAAGRPATLQGLLAQSTDAALVLDETGKVLFANTEAGELFECTPDELAGRSLGLPCRGERPARLAFAAPSGRRAHVELHVAWLRSGGSDVAIAQLRDVSIQVRQEERLQASEQRYDLAAAGAHDGLWHWDLATNQVHYSPRWRAMLGLEDTELEPTPEGWLGRIHPDEVERVRAALSAHLQQDTESFESEYRILHENGTYHWVLCRGVAARDEHGRALRMAGSQTDVTSRKQAEEQLARRAFYDPLTNLPNRALFLDRLRHAVRRGQRRAEHQFAVLFLDVDRFKTINDSLGHIAGDRLLVSIARRLELSLRPGDTVARLGGDEFTVLLDDIRDAADATAVAERIQSELGVPFTVAGQELFTSASIGIALSATGYERPEDIVRDADTAMYRAKASGKAQHALFDTGMHERAVALMRTEADLRRALERDELEVHYQPIVSLERGHIRGLEALVRWRHPRRGLVSPGEFIPLAEETGLILPIGLYVLETACQQMSRWHDTAGSGEKLELSVNLSSRQFSGPDLVAQVRETLEKTGLEANCLRLELTESLLMENRETVTEMLVALRKLGVQLSIDDFGTGYSSLAYLQRFPIDHLKIDRSFVRPMADPGEDYPIARTIVSIGHNLGMSVVAEGIETPTQLQHLRELECESGQGFLFSKPLNAHDTAELLEAAPSW